jgi:hypothetical protein
VMGWRLFRPLAQVENALVAIESGAIECLSI